MPLYSYHARDKEGNTKSGDIRMKSEAKLAKWLYTQGFILTKFKISDSKKKSNKILKAIANLGSVSMMEKVLLTRYLEVMLKAGLSLTRSLSILANQTENKKLKNIISQVRKDVEGGKPFYKSLAKHPRVFSDLYVHVVKTGEVSGGLSDVLDQLATQIKKDREMIKKVTSALIYPTIVVIAMIGIGLLMVMYILPKLTKIFEEFETELPLPTRMLISVTNFMSSNGLLVIAGLFLLIFLLYRFMRTKSGKKIFHRIYLRLPVFGKIVKKINIARFIRNLGSMLSAGLPILKSLSIVADALGNVYYQKAIKASVEDVRKGTALSKSLSKNPNLFPPIVTQVIEVGEETGSIEDIMERLAGFYEDDVDQTMKNISTVIEPVLMLIMGVGIGGMAISVIMPIYNLTSNM